MKRALLPYMLLAAAAIFSLLISQGLWIAAAVQQENEYRKERFQQSFNRAVSFSVSSDSFPLAL